MSFPHRSSVAPCCAVSRQQPARRTGAQHEPEVEEARLQRRFERICARELMGEID